MTVSCDRRARYLLMHARTLLLAAVVAGCGTPARTPTPVTRDALVGTWTHERPNHESYELMLFASDIVGFLHVGEKLPISQSYGRWSFEEGTLDLHIVGSEPETAAFPLANRIIVQLDGNALSFALEGARSTWTLKDRYGRATAGATERAAADERDWTTRVERAEQATASVDQP